MNKSESIRALGRKGHSVADIARQLGVRYQFARNVLLAASLLTKKPPAGVGASQSRRAKPEKPRLHAADLVRAGFERSSRWMLGLDGSLRLEQPLPASRGVYCMALDGTALYVGLATMGIAKRFHFYARPGSTQRTSLRINALLKTELRELRSIEIYTATPADLEWKGLPVSGIAGLELGLIEKYLLPWNIRGAKT